MLITESDKLQETQCQAPSTRIWILLKTHLFYPFWVSAHTETAFPVIKSEAFRKPPPEWIYFENVFMLSCGRVKTELFETTEVKTSIYNLCNQFITH